MFTWLGGIEEDVYTIEYIMFFIVYCSSMMHISVQALLFVLIHPLPFGKNMEISLSNNTKIGVKFVFFHTSKHV